MRPLISTERSFHKHFVQCIRSFSNTSEIPLLFPRKNQRFKNKIIDYTHHCLFVIAFREATQRVEPMKLCVLPQLKPQPCKKSADLATCERPLNLHAISAASKKGRCDGSVKWAAIIMALTFGTVGGEYLVKTWHTSLILIHQGITFQSRVRGVKEILIRGRRLRRVGCRWRDIEGR